MRARLFLFACVLVLTWLMIAASGPPAHAQAVPTTRPIGLFISRINLSQIFDSVNPGNAKAYDLTNPRVLTLGRTERWFVGSRSREIGFPIWPDHEDNGMMELVRIDSTTLPGLAPVRVGRSREEEGHRVAVNPPSDGRPSLLLFVKGSACPHCLSQLTKIATALSGRNVSISVISASPEGDLQNFPRVPGRLIADPDHRLFKRYGAYDREAKHATIVKDRFGKELLRKVGEEPFTDVNVVLAALDQAANDASAEVRIREDADTLLKPENKAKLDALKLAFKTLQDSTDPAKNMKFWANIHGAPFPEVPTGPCEHFNEVIWPWHRAYLYEFETALRESHPPETSNVTLPYWNWNAPPSGQRFPKIFEEAGSPLNYASRNTTPFPDAPVPTDGEQMLLEIPSWEAFGGRPKATPGKGTMEAQYHDTVHGFIGGHNLSTARSARDPIFWAHHANLDRIWLAWQAKWGQLPVGANEPILGFPGVVVKDWNDVSAKYLYGPKETPTPEARPRFFANRLALRKREALATYPVELSRPGPTDRVLLELSDVRPPSQEPHFFTAEIYLHPKDVMADAVQAKYFLAQFSFFDSTHPQHAGAAAPQAGGTVLLDVSTRARAILQASGDRPLAVSMRFIGNIQKNEADELATGVATGVRVGKVAFLVKPAPEVKKGDAPGR